jgi:quaternary ammonium compound-resistance protein SugE
MPWFHLALAAVFEIVFATSMKASEGFTRPGPTAITVVGIVGGMYFLGLAMKQLPVSVAYPVWVGVGTAGAVLLGAWLFGETLTLLKLASVALIALGVAGLRAAA